MCAVLHVTVCYGPHVFQSLAGLWDASQWSGDTWPVTRNNVRNHLVRTSSFKFHFVIFYAYWGLPVGCMIYVERISVLNKYVALLKNIILKCYNAGSLFGISDTAVLLENGLYLFRWNLEWKGDLTVCILHKTSHATFFVQITISGRLQEIFAINVLPKEI